MADSHSNQLRGDFRSAISTTEIMKHLVRPLYLDMQTKDLCNVSVMIIEDTGSHSWAKSPTIISSIVFHRHCIFYTFTMTMLTHPQSKLVESESIAPAQSTIIQKAPAFASRILHHTRDGIALTPYNSPAYAPPIAARDHIAASSLRARILVPRPSGEQVMPGNLAKIGYTIANSVTTDEDPTKAQPEPEKMVPTKE